MKKIGLIGGTGPESTLVYYKEINRLLHEKSGGKKFPEIAIESINLYQALKYVEEMDYESLQCYLMKALQNLRNGGADILALTAGTMHVVYEELKEQMSVPIVSIPETVCEVALRKRYKKVGLIGTIFTMQKDYMKKPFRDNQIEVVTPSLKEMTLINERIYQELEYGIVKESTQQELLQVIKKMQEEEGIEAIMLGCTELPLAISNKNSPVACLNIMEIHIKKLVELAIED